MKEIINDYNKMKSKGPIGRGWVYYIIFFFIVLGALVVNNPFENNNSFPLILTMDSLGYENSITENVNLRPYRNNINLYELRIANADTSDDDYEFINLRLYDASDVNSANDVMNKEMLSIKKSEQEWLSECKGNCISLNNIKDIDQDKDFFSLNSNEWNVEKAYSLYDYKHYPDKKYYQNYIFLQKENRVLVLEFKVSFEMTPQRIDVLKGLIDVDIF